MKNIHILPTDKPSRLRFFCGRLELMRLVPKKSDIIFQHIYITSNEEIKDGDWMIRGNEQPTLVTPNFFWDFGVRYYKIILTTDQDLIKDGAQAISDEFLEWFVKNSSCEFVEVQKWTNYSEVKYKLIIPQEEPKQEKKPHSFCETPEEKCVMNYCDENGCQNRKRHLVEPHEQDTLEEAAEKAFPTDPGVPIDSLNKLELIKYLNNAKKKEGFIAGANYQAKRMYSEEEVLHMLGSRTQYCSNTLEENWSSTNEWFKQLKKK